MTERATPGPAIRLLATDLDGTVIGGVQEFPLYTEFRKELAWLRDAQGAVWVACTGRSLSSFIEFTMPLQRMGVVPDYVIVHHAYIYSRRRYCWWPHVLWNIHIRHQLWVDWRAAKRALANWHEAIMSCSIGVRTTRRDRESITLLFDSAPSALEAMAILKRDYPGCRHIQVAVNEREMKVRLVPFTKGLALSEMARYLGVPPTGILAIGNGHNDISMLDGAVARMTGCPSNSEREVMEAVQQSAGHIADRPSLGGVLQVIDAFRRGTVSSEMPPEVIPAMRQDRLSGSKRKRSRTRNPRHVRIALGLALMGYIVLLVFASFGIVPYSSLILKPFILLQKILLKLFM